MKKTSIKLLLLVVIGFSVSCNAQHKTVEKKENWKKIFNGKDLTDWNVKITGHNFNENYKNTFRVAEGGILQVNYDQYNGVFNNSFGHIFYKNEYSNYKLRLEYRFTGEQLIDMEPWAKRNSGIMIHCQNPKSMGVDQKFPVSIEVQLLGGLDEGERPTGNVCTPGTHIYLADKLEKQHCIKSSSKTFNGDQWVTIEVLVMNDEVISHKINGEEVLKYYKPQFGGDVDVDNENWKKKEGTPLKKGFISLQSETHPVEFRNIELLQL